MLAEYRLYLGNIRSPSMPLSDSITPHLPSLRRFARTLSGSQASGDAYVVALLETMVEDPLIFPSGLDPKIALYKLFLRIWNSVGTNIFPNFSGEESEALRGLQTLTPVPRQAFLLLSVEGFNPSAIAEILETDIAGIAELIDAADREIACQLDSADILIIEDEPLAACHLAELVEGLGHRVTGVGRTHTEALKFARGKKPDLILSDIQLADGSSGIEAVNEILSNLEIPVVFITGHPEMLLTGQKPEPTFLIPKPFDARTVKAIIGQALFFQVVSRCKAAIAETKVHTEAHSWTSSSLPVVRAQSEAAKL
jgi:CheY-like chemotaxis protein/DNA-directed RNA polymerase specialized sigma24 family protein